MLKCSAWSLDYEKYAVAELRELIEARIGTTLSEKERKTIYNCNRYQLANRLHRIDQASTFRFMELPPELHLRVYELLLVDERERGNEGYVVDWNGAPSRFRLHPTVLQTSKQIYSEAQPVLYRQNKFEATIMVLKDIPDSGCVMKLIMPGERCPYLQTVSSSRVTPLLGELFEHPAMGMLRSLTHLTINSSLAEDHGRDEYVSKARDAVACLCLSLTGASKMKELTINVELGDLRERHKVDFACMLWPLISLRTDIVVKFEGIAELLKVSKTDPRTVPHAEASYGRHIAKIRQRCNEEIAKQGSDVVGLRGIETALASINYFGDEFVRMDDIVNLSAAWTGLRSEADRFEAMDLDKESLS